MIWSGVLTVLCFLLFDPFFLVPGQAAAELPLQFRRFTARDGLPAGAVHGVLQDSRGFIWLATYNGLVRYDGSEFRIYRHDTKDRHSLIDNRVRCLQEDRQGNLWLGTEGGLELWDRKLERFTHVQISSDHTNSAESVRCLLLDRQGFLWVGTYGAGWGVFRYASGPQQFQRLGLPPAQIDAPVEDGVLALCQDHAGIVWVGTEGRGLIEWHPDTGQSQTFERDPANARALGSRKIRALCEDQQGRLWIGTDSGLLRLSSERLFPVAVNLNPDDPSAPAAPIVDALMVDFEGRVWVGTDGYGLSMVNPANDKTTTFRRVRFSPESLSSDVIRTIFQDRQGDLWIGCYPDSVNHASHLNAAFRTYRSIPGQSNTLSDESVTAFLEDPDGDLWVGTDKGGLNRLDHSTGTWSHFDHDPQHPQGLGANSIIALGRDDRKHIWLGTWKGGLHRFNPATSTFQRYRLQPGRTDSISQPHVNAITEDQQGLLWIATSSGLYRYLAGADRFVGEDSAPENSGRLPHEDVRCLLVTRDGCLWAGMRLGLARRSPNTRSWEPIQPGPNAPRDLSFDEIVDLLEDAHGQIWIATEEDGLRRFDPNTKETVRFRVNDGLASDALRSLLEDDLGHIWIATKNGLSRFDPQTRRFLNYGESSGLQGRQFNVQSRLRLRSGDLLFGGTEGFSRILPRALHLNTNAPPVVLTRLDIFGEPMKPGDRNSPLTNSITETQQLSISARASVISLQFAALNYHAPELNQFLFKLEGFDRAWRKAGPERRATYTNLDPGRYQFRVRAANNEGLWSEPGANLYITITPQWWQRTSFQGGLVFALVCGLITTGWSVANRKANARLHEAERERQLAQERQQASEALRESETRYQRLLEHASDGISIVQNGNIQTLNGRFAAMCGYPLAEVIRQPLASFIHAEDRPMVIQRHRERLLGDTNLPTAYRFRVMRKDGSPLWVELNTTMIHWEGQPATLNILRDITERQQAENQRLDLERQMQQMQKLESLGVLAGGIAHDFNNLLTVILGNADLALDELPRQSPARECLCEVRETSLRAAELCRQMLAYSGRGQFVIETIDLTNLVESMVNLLKTSVSKKAVLTLSLDRNLPAIRGDATQIRQIVMNLVINASEALGENNGAIRLSTGARYCSSAFLQETCLHEKPAEGNYVWLEVTDTGCGMDAETQRRIFEPFFTTKFTGRGLGLSAVLGIVRGHRGAVKLTSDPGQGTCFQVLLPVSNRESASAIPQSEPPPTWKGSGTILLVDDEEKVRLVGQRMLARLGFTVITAANGREALEQYRLDHDQLKLVLLDLTMPELGGVETFLELRRINSAVPILMVTGYNENDIGTRTAGLGLAGIIQKPYTLSRLEEHLRTVLNS
jgi:PAS domain S-box-containing protein